LCFAGLLYQLKQELDIFALLGFAGHVVLEQLDGFLWSLSQERGAQKPLEWFFGFAVNVVVDELLEQIGLGLCECFDFEECAVDIPAAIPTSPKQMAQIQELLRGAFLDLFGGAPEIPL
jgi:hypothetical protein